MLTRLIVKNFKSIGEPGIDIELRPLTIFVGPNGGGKSSILEALAFLAQNVGNHTRELNTAGELVEYPGIASVAHRGELPRRITIGLASSDAEDLYRFTFRADTGEASQEFMGDSHPIWALTLKGDLRRGHTVYWTEGEREYEVVGSEGMEILGAIRLRTSEAWDSLKEPLKTYAVVRDVFVPELRNNVFLVSALRGEVPSQLSTGKDALWVGKRCENVLIVLSRISSPVYENVNKRVQHWASEFGLTRVWAGLTATNTLAGQFVDQVLNVPLNLSLASHGSRQILGVITQLFWAKPGSIVMIEEPELSLHPEAQDKLPALFADAIRDGKQVMITTHSHYLLLALTEAVKADPPAKDIAVYEVKKEPEVGTTARRLPVTKEGYIRGWVSSYAKVDKALLERRNVGVRGRKNDKGKS